MARELKAEQSNTFIRPLAGLGGVAPLGPDWFKRAIEAPFEDGAVDVKGARITYSVWGEAGRPGLLFVHGGRAHRNWWRPFAPFLATQFRVAAFDLSGMGDSGWRERYSLDLLVDEVFAVSEAAGLMEHGRPLVVGHSFGGWVTLAAVEREGARLAGAVIIDSPIGLPDPDEGYTISKANTDKPNAHRANRVYGSLAEPISRFRFLPNQPCEHLFLADFIAREGLKKAPLEGGGEGWVWKFDPAQGRNFDIQFARDLFLAARCPLAFIYGEDSQFAQGDGFSHLKNRASGRSPFIVVPAAHHHLMMDQPLAFVAVLRTLLSCWPVRVGV